MDSPLVSIITPIYNADKYLEATLTSIQNQTYGHWELILIDDASTDRSSLLARKFYTEDARIKYERMAQNSGTAVCRNRGIELANGDYIAFLDADDLWVPDKLEMQLEFMQRQACDVSFSSYQWIDEMGNPLHKRVRALKSLSYQKQLKNNYIGNLTGMYCSKTLGKIYCPLLRKRQDWGLWLNAIKKSGKPAQGLQLDLAFYRKRKDAISTNKFTLVKYNYAFYRDFLGQSSISAGFSLLRFFWEYFFVRPKYIERIN